ncbi:DNA-directed RNA polymerase II core subunit [Ascochyta rabiei]|uniref:DNA-directed RNA polymerase II core subunit n=1 Tax=Didymella rabiei TaxID=5454 RepID=UPI001900148D|nr:DNA-directed RNA polymerase II core subunit [Ascochyta rabiei]UPX17712.1 DNA-directed RNA polymerase II core subunit [Ascochyta rabiei]
MNAPDRYVQGVSLLIAYQSVVLKSSYGGEFKQNHGQERRAYCLQPGAYPTTLCACYAWGARDCFVSDEAGARGTWAGSPNVEACKGIPKFELFLLDDGQQKVEYKEETRVPNTAIFTFNKEDHTLGNLLSQRLLKYDHIVFSAYKVPHPLFATFELRVQTDGTITPKEAIIRCCKDIVQDLHVLNSSFQTEWLGKKIVSEGEADRIARERDAF